MAREGIRIVAAAGSVRDGNYTKKALAIVLEELRQRENIQVSEIDLSAVSLELPGRPETADAKALQEKVSQATGVVLATPEYHGSYSSTMKLLIDNLGFPSSLSGKPVALLGVAAGQIGAIKALEHLRSVCSHVGAIVLPGPVSIAGVHNLFDEQGRCLDESTEKRIRGLAGNLLDYIKGNICPRLALEEMTRRGEVDWMRRCAD